MADNVTDIVIAADTPPTPAPRGNCYTCFLVVSSDIHGGSREASFDGRRDSLRKKVPGAELTWLRAPDLARFGLAIEQAEVSPEHRERIRWDRLCGFGDVHWDSFETELRELSVLGYSFPEVT